MGVKLTEVHWYQAGANAPGREEKVELEPSRRRRLTRVSDKSLSEMLASGEIDCAIIARPPTCFLEGHPDVVRLFPDYLRDGRGVLPAGQGLADHAHHRHPEARLGREPVDRPQPLQRVSRVESRSLERLLDPAVSRYPCLAAHLRAEDARLFGGDPFPFGIDENRATLEPLALYAVPARDRAPAVTVDEMFPTGVMTKVVI